jgi:tRNA(fMet)-specific endonuclease VapC
MYLVDTDRAADHLNRQGAGFRLIPSLRDEGLAISIVTYAELYEGVLFGQRENHAEALAAFVAEVIIVPVSVPIAQRFAVLRGDLRSQGLLIPDMDLFIAATAIEHGLTLVTGNRRHFERIPDLTLHAGD